MIQTCVDSRITIGRRSFSEVAATPSGRASSRFIGSTSSILGRSVPSLGARRERNSSFTSAIVTSAPLISTIRLYAAEGAVSRDLKGRSILREMLSPGKLIWHEVDRGFGSSELGRGPPNQQYCLLAVCLRMPRRPNFHNAQISIDWQRYGHIAHYPRATSQHQNNRNASGKDKTQAWDHQDQRTRLPRDGMEIGTCPKARRTDCA